MLALLITPVTEVTMPNPAAPFQDFRQLMRYRERIDFHGLKGRMVFIELDPSGEMYFERDGKRVRL